MNNTIYKNYQYDKQQLTELPYSDPRHIEYAEGTGINAIRLNNTFKQLVDNDKSVECSLYQLSSYVAGPKSIDLDRTSDITKLYDAENGYKFWLSGASNQLSIAHKVDCDLQKSIFKTSLSSGNVYDFCQFAGTTIAATDKGIYTIDKDGNSELFTEYNVLDNSIIPEMVICKDIFHDGYRTLFATNIGIYELSSETVKEESELGTKFIVKLSLCKRNKTYLQDCRSVYIRADNNMMFVSTANGTYFGKYNSHTALADIELDCAEFICSDLSAQAIAKKYMLLEPNQLIVQQANDVLALTDDGLYLSKALEKSVVGKDHILRNQDTQFAFVFEDIIYIGAANGIYDVMTGNKVLNCDVCSYVIADNVLYIGSIGVVYKIQSLRNSTSHLMQLSEIVLPTLEAVVKIQSIGKYDNQTIGVHELLLCNTADRKTFTIDTKTDTVAIFQATLSGKGSASNGKLVITDGNDQLSVLSIERASGDIKSETLDNNLVASRPYDNLVDVTADKDHIVAQDKKLTNLTTNKTYTTTATTKIVKLGTAVNGYEYAYIDANKLALLNSRMAVNKSQISSNNIVDTTHLLIGSWENNIFTIDKDVFPEEYGMTYLDQLSIGNEFQLAASGRFAYVLDRNELSVFSEVYLLNIDNSLSNAIRTNTATEKAVNIIDGKTVALDMSLVAYADKLVVNVMSAEYGSDEGITISKTFPMMLNDAVYDNANSIKVSTPTGLSTIQLSLDLSSTETPISIIGIQPDISATNILAYHKVDVPNPYEFIASDAEISVRHDEYTSVDNVDASYGKHLVDSVAHDDGADHSFYALWNDSELHIYDNGIQTIVLNATKINDVTYSLSGKATVTNKLGKVYIAAADGLSSYDAQTTLSNDVSSFGNLQLVSPAEFKSVKCLALSDEQIGIYLATDTSICALNDSTIVELCSGFTNVQNLNGFAVKDLCVLLFTDSSASNNELKLYDIKTHALSSFSSISNVSQLAVVGDTNESAELSDLSLIWNDTSSLKTTSILSLLADDIQPIVLGNGNDLQLSIFSDFRVNNHITVDDKLKLTLDARRHSKTYVQSYDPNTDIYSILEYSQTLDNPVMLTSDTPVAYANFMNDKLYPTQYASASKLMEYGTVSKVILDKVCYDFYSLVDNGQISVFCRNNNDVLSIGFKANAKLADIVPSSTPILHNISAYSVMDGNIVYISANSFFDNMYDADSRIKLVDYSSESNIDAVRMFTIDKVQSDALSIAQDTIVMIGSNGTAWTFQKDSTTLDQVPIATYVSVDELASDGTDVYVRTGSQLSSIDKHVLRYEASLSSDSILWTIPRKTSDKKIFFYKSTDGWKYVFNGKTFNYIPQSINGFDYSSYSINNILTDAGTNLLDNTISAITTAGIYTTKFLDQLKLSEMTQTITKKLQYPVKAIYGKEHNEGSDGFVVILSSNNGLSAMSYDASTNRLTDKATVTYEDQTAFDSIVAVDGSLDSGMFYALSGSQFFLTNADGSSGILNKYNDERLSNFNVKINTVQHIDGKNYINTDKGTFISKENGRSIEFQYQCNKGTDFNSSIQQNNLTSILAGHDGIYTLVNRGNQLSVSIYKNSLCTDHTTALAQWNFTGTSPKYAYAVSNDILTSDNCKDFTKFVTLPNDVSTIYSIFPLNMHDFFFGTDAGAYMTHYEYELSNDLRKFTASDARKAYDGVEDLLDMTLSDAIDSHIASDHAASSLMTYLNDNFLPADMSDMKLSTWGNVSYNAASSEMKVTDDLVDTIEFGDETTGDVTVTLSNFLTSDSNAKCSYIIKRFMSGLTELYIYVPTTNTYYINHIAGIPKCTKSQATNIDRQNLYKFKTKPFVADMSKHYSTFEIGIASVTLSIDTLLGIEAYGNSLPLKCYRDKKFPDDDPTASLLWHSYIQPTEIMTYPSSQQPDSNGEYKFKFACFGSDAQAIKLTAFDPVHNTNAIRYIVRFNANGAQGVMAAQKFIANMPQKLRACIYKWPDSVHKTFAGWTEMPNPTYNTEVQYSDGQLFSRTDVKNGSIIDLYAIWIDYEWTNIDNQFALADTKDELFFNHADILNDETLGNTALIDYGK